MKQDWTSTYPTNPQMPRASAMWPSLNLSSTLMGTTPQTKTTFHSLISLALCLSPVFSSSWDVPLIPPHSTLLSDFLYVLQGQGKMLPSLAYVQFSQLEMSLSLLSEISYFIIWVRCVMDYAKSLVFNLWQCGY